VLVQGNQRLVQPQVAQQLAGGARVFTGHGVHQAQHKHRTQRDVGQVADGRGHHVQCPGRVVLAAGGGGRRLLQQ
jgi:hypothetical protein